MNHWRRAEDRRRLAFVEQVVRPARDANWLAAADGPRAVRLGPHVEVRLDNDGRPSAVVVALAAEPEPRPQPDAPRPRRRRDAWACLAAWCTGRRAIGSSYCRLHEHLDG